MRAIFPNTADRATGTVDNGWRAGRACNNSVMATRFLTLTDVQEILNISSPQAYALVRSGELPAIQVGGRGQWRVEASELEAYIARQYAANEARIKASTDS